METLMIDTYEATLIGVGKVRFVLEGVNQE